MIEVKIPKDFDWEYYLEFNLDLKPAGLTTEKQAITHYINHGFAEKRIYKSNLPKNFNWKEFALLNLDLLVSGMITKQSIEYFYHQHGISQQREFVSFSCDVKFPFMKTVPIFVFYHIYCKNDWKEIVIEQINQLKISGLFDVIDEFYINIVGEKTDRDFIVNLLSDDKIKISLIDNCYEFLTLELIKDVCNKKKFKGFYFHTKSTSYEITDKKKKLYHFWRNLMSHQLINNWKVCYQQIFQHDVVGTLFRKGNISQEEYWSNDSKNNENKSKYFTDHFSGNFYWFDSVYFSTIPNLTENQKKNRFNAEWFIFRNKPNYLTIFNDTLHFQKQLDEQLINLQ